ncbi:hypothetical protein [Micromonospora sp. NPDC049374]|uniref:hypothetical protein n=1 Tax=Micromonospora sp. NPDC049374 TaxID=3154352 RepID=UPI0034292823
MPSASPVAVPDAGTVPARRASRILTTAIVVLVGVLLVHVLVETWAQVLTGPSSEDPRANLENAAQWPKHVKTGLYLGLAALTVTKVLLDRLWQRFRTFADLALVVLGLVMLLAGVVNDSSMTLMGEALFVYFRGVIVFYALRAADLNWVLVRRMLIPVAVVLGVNVVLALVQMVIGHPAYTALGWVDLTWADQSRAQGLQPHPNHLGHLLGLALLGFIAWVAVSGRVGRSWWIVASVAALAMSATQSRESLLGVLAAGLLIAVLVRGSARRVLGVCLIVVLCTVAQIAVRPDNRAEWERRLENTLTGFRNPAGSEPERVTPPAATATPSVPSNVKPSSRPGDAEATPSAEPSPRATNPSARPTATSQASQGTPQATTSAKPSSAAPSPAPVREIRVLYLQQAARILPRQPILGFGIGQFGGIVAEKDNPNWHKNPKFGPEGFNRYGFQAVQVDSFWLHLVMEVGLLGLVVYLVWLAAVARPLVHRARHDRRSRRASPQATIWGIAAIVFACVVGFLSPSMEDPLLPPLLWAIVAVGWWATRQPGDTAVTTRATGVPSPLPAARNGEEADTQILSTDEILAQSRQARRSTDFGAEGVNRTFG